MSGVQYFGLASGDVIKALQQLPNADKCSSELDIATLLRELDSLLVDA